MDSTEDGHGSLIHPAFHVRISQVGAARQRHISQTTAKALITLTNTVTSLRRTADAMAACPELAQVVSEIEPILIVVSTSLQRWNSGKIPPSSETEAMVASLRALNAVVSMVKELWAASKVMPAVPNASSNYQPCHTQSMATFYVEADNHSVAWRWLVKRDPPDDWAPLSFHLEDAAVRHAERLNDIEAKRAGRTPRGCRAVRAEGWAGMQSRLSE
jgi:hypothetical protein